MVKQYLKIELKKAMSKWFWFVVLIGTGLTLFNNYEIYQNAEQFFELNKMAGTYAQEEFVGLSLFGNWIGCESMTLGFSLFFFLFPLLAAMAYGWSFHSELKRGYIKNVTTRTRKMNYYAAKYIATFLVGGLAVVIPLGINMLISLLYSNAAIPDVIYQYFSMGHGSLWSRIYFSQPFLFCVIYLFVDFFFCGSIACLSMALSFFVKNRITVLLTPFLALLAVDYLRWKIMEVLSISYEVSPIRFLHPTPYPLSVSGNIIFVWGVFLFLGALLICLIKGRSNDIF